MVAIAGAGVALLAGSPPADAATPAAHAAAAYSSWRQFGVYYTLDACEYYGRSLTSASQFTDYDCVPYAYPGGPMVYWALYVYS